MAADLVAALAWMIGVEEHAGAERFVIGGKPEIDHQSAERKRERQAPFEQRDDVVNRREAEAEPMP